MGLDECFDFDFVGLPHFLFQRPQFDAGVAEMTARLTRTTGSISITLCRLTEQSRGDYFFKPNYSKNNPADGFASYAKGYVLV